LAEFRTWNGTATSDHSHYCHYLDDLYHRLDPTLPFSAGASATYRARAGSPFICLF
jgi:hypothetical protein